MTEIQQNLYPQYQYQQQFGAHNVASKGLEEYKPTNNRLVSAVTDSVNSEDGKNTMPSSFLLGLLASMGIVHGTNKLLQPKAITDSMTQYDTYTNSRLYKMGATIDNSKPVQWISNKVGAVKGKLSKIPVPKFIQEMGEKWKIGSISTWDKTGMWTQGKKVEAMNEFLTFLSKTKINKLGLPENELNLVKETLKQFNAGKIKPTEAFKVINPVISKCSAKVLAAASPKTGLFAKLFGYGKVNNLNLSLSKAQTLSKNAGGVIGKNGGKLATMLGEASGGGVLGGPGALLFNAFFIAQNLNEARKAEDGEKLKTFMDEFFSTTIGSYFMQMYIGEKFNKFLGLAELGMDLKSPEMQKIIKDLKLDNPKSVLEVVNAYNKFIPKNKALSKALEKIGRDEISVKKASDLLNKYGVEVGMKEKALAKIMNCIENGKVAENGKVVLKGAKRAKGVITPERALKILKRYGITPNAETIEAIGNATGQNLKTSITNILQKEIKSPEQMETMYNGIKQAMKSNITFKSIFKNTDGTSFINRLGRYIVQKPLAKITKWMSVGKYTLSKPNGNLIGNFARKFKRVGGGIGRIILVAFVLVPPVAGLFTKFSHKVFGKPKKKILEEEQAKLEAEMANNPQSQPNGTKNEYVPFSNQNKNLVEMYTGKKPSEIQNNGDTATYIPNQKLKGENETNYDTAIYMPNQMLTQESFVDPNVTQDLLARRDAAVRRAEATERNYKELLNRL